MVNAFRPEMLAVIEHNTIILPVYFAKIFNRVEIGSPDICFCLFSAIASLISAHPLYFESVHKNFASLQN